jgi:WbqC-like protein family
VNCLERVCSYLGIPFRFSLLSELKLDLGPVAGPGDWALRVAQALGNNEYINAPGGTDLFDRSKFDEAGIKLTIQTPLNFTYNCDGYNFQPNLSIIDVLMWNSPADIRTYFASRLQECKN